MVNLKEPEKGKGSSSSIFSPLFDLKNWIPKQQRLFAKNFVSFIHNKTWVGAKWIASAAWVLGVTMVFTLLPYSHVISLDLHAEAEMSKQSPYETNPQQ